MNFKNIAIETLAYALPESILSSDEIEERLSALYERLKLPKGRLELMTGIRERRIWPEGTQPSDASAAAGRNALAQSSIKAENIDLLIHSAVCRDRLEPATAAYVHNLLKLPSTTQILDISNACLGFLNALVLASGLIESKQVKNVLVVAGENGSPLIEGTIKKLLDPSLTRKSIKPFFANLTVGCAAVAAILCSTVDIKDKHAIKLTTVTTRTDSDASKLCEGVAGPDGSLEMQTDSEQLLEAGIILAKETWTAFKQESGWNEQTPDRTICHQVGRQHQKRLYEALSIDINKDYSTFPILGNVGSVSLPITLAHALEAGQIKDSSKIALLGIGSGLSCMMLALET